jgi:hypothetical protein
MKGVSERLLIRVAAQNNAEWCDAFSRTHGIVGQFGAGRWFSPVRTPRYYPDAVTLLPEITIEQVLSGIDASEGLLGQGQLRWLGPCRRWVSASVQGSLARPGARWVARPIRSAMVPLDHGGAT